MNFAMGLGDSENDKTGLKRDISVAYKNINLARINHLGTGLAEYLQARTIDALAQADALLRDGKMVPNDLAEDVRTNAQEIARASMDPMGYVVRRMREIEDSVITRTPVVPEDTGRGNAILLSVKKELTADPEKVASARKEYETCQEIRFRLLKEILEAERQRISKLNLKNAEAANIVIDYVKDKVEASNPALCDPQKSMFVDPYNESDMESTALSQTTGLGRIVSDDSLTNEFQTVIDKLKSKAQKLVGTPEYEAVNTKYTRALDVMSRFQHRPPAIDSRPELRLPRFVK